jgi:hypothetical protein
MESIFKEASGHVGFGGLVQRLRVWFSDMRLRARRAREERRAERDLIRYYRAMAGMSDHMRRDVGLPPSHLLAHYLRFVRRD